MKAVINKIDHINMSVSNLNESINFYKKYFAMEIKEENRQANEPWAIIGVSDKLLLALYEIKDFKSEKQHINHFGINVENFSDFLGLVRQEGLKINEYGSEVLEYDHSKSFYISDPDGNEIEISENFGNCL